MTDRRSTHIVVAGLIGIFTISPAPAQAPQTIELSGVVRDFKRVHPDFNVIPIGGPGHYAGNVDLSIGAGDVPVFAGGGFKVGDQWLNSGTQPIAPHLFSAGSTGTGEVLLVNGPQIDNNPTLDTWDSSDGPYTPGGPAPDFQTGSEMPEVTVPVGLPWTNGWKLDGNGTTTLSSSTHCSKFEIINYQTLKISGDVVIVAEELFKVNNHVTVEMLPGATLEIYALKGCEITNNVNFNVNTGDPSLVTIHYLGNAVFKLSNHVELYAQIVAPDGKLLIENNADFYGNYVGKNFHIKNSGDFHADTNAGGAGTMVCGSPLNDTAGTATMGGDGAITAADTFDDWYGHALGVNLAKDHSITLTRNGAGVYEYLDDEFYPVDGQLFGNEGDPHNYYFTYGIDADFTYIACTGQFMEFAGADDCWIFIDGFLGIDLGGIMPGTNQIVELDRLGLTDGQSYKMQLFFAHRESTESSFALRTNLILANDELYVTVSLPCD